MAYCYVTPDKATLFINTARVSAEAAAELKENGVELAEYDDVLTVLAAQTEEQTVLADPASVNYAVYQTLQANPALTVKDEADPLLPMKGVKNEVELAHTRETHIRDGVAMVRFQIELENRLAAGEELTELTIDEILHKYRSAQDKFLTESFGTIAAYGPNAAMMHYHATEEDHAKLEKKGFLLDKRNGVSSGDKKEGDDSKDVADNSSGNSNGDGGKTRKKSDKNMENYRKIVIADDSEVDQRYKSDYRGRVQDRNVTIKLEPMYALTYYEKLSDVKRIVHYHKYIEELNHSKLFPKPLRITNMEAPLTEEQVRFHFALIDAHTSDVVADEKNAKKRFMRGLDFYLVQDFASSIDDFTKSILLDDTFFPAYFMRALVRYKQLEYKKAEATMSEGATSGTTEMKKPEVTAIDYEVVKNDLDHVIQLAPDFVYGYYNRGNVSSLLKDYRAALADYDKAIELSPDFAEAYFNRGLTHIFLGNNKQGIADLSKAG